MPLIEYLSLSPPTENKLFSTCELYIPQNIYTTKTETQKQKERPKISLIGIKSQT